MRTASLVAVVLVASGCFVVEPPTATIEPAKSAVPASPSPSSVPTKAPTAAPTTAPTPTPAPTEAPTPSPPRPTPSPPLPTPSATPPVISTAEACGDDAYSLTGDRWAETYVWYFSIGSVPGYLEPADVLVVLKSALDHITGARNDCGLPDHVGAEALYGGTTDELPCATSNEHNVIGFANVPRRLGSDVIAYTCSYSDTSGEVFAADVMLDTDVIWALSSKKCRGHQELLEATMTHEIGHIFGLGHVSERRHGELTMSTRISGCDDESATLGLGDILGLEALYRN